MYYIVNIREVNYVLTIATRETIITIEYNNYFCCMKTPTL